MAALEAAVEGTLSQKTALLVKMTQGTLVALNTQDAPGGAEEGLEEVEQMSFAEQS